jgi:TPR repeat protein
MKAVKIVLIVLAILVLTPIVLLQALGLYSTTHFARIEAQEKKEKEDQLAKLPAGGVRDCVGMQQNRPSAWDVGDEKYRKHLQDWLDICQRVAALQDAPVAVHHSLADAFFAADRRAESAAVLRALAAKGDADALLEIYERHRSFEQGDLDKAQIINAKEAGDSLRKAAESGHPKAMLRYAINLDQGRIIKRDVEEAAHWMEQTLARPPKDASTTDLAVSIGQLLTESAKPEKRARGLRILESINRPNARAYLGIAIRKDDPVRARALFEETLSAWPGISLAPLADMLIKGEGGPRDEKRALKLLQSHSNKSAPSSINEALGKLYAEGKLVPRDPQRAFELMGGAAQWSIDKRIALGRFVAENPAVRVDRPKDLLYDLTHAAELGEPGAMSALIALKLSANARFADKAGGCKLAERAAKDGDETARKLLATCT